MTFDLCLVIDSLPSPTFIPITVGSYRVPTYNWERVFPICVNSLQCKLCRGLQEQINRSGFTPLTLKHIRGVFGLFCISGPRVIVILCFPQTLRKRKKMTSCYNSGVIQGKWERSDFPLDNKHPIFPDFVCSSDRTLSLVSHHWSLLMQTVSGAFFIRRGSHSAMKGRLPIGGRGHLEQVCRCCLC